MDPNQQSNFQPPAQQSISSVDSQLYVQNISSENNNKQKPILVIVFILLILIIAIGLYLIGMQQGILSSISLFKNTFSKVSTPTSIVIPTITQLTAQNSIIVNWQVYSNQYFTFKFPNDWKAVNYVEDRKFNSITIEPISNNKQNPLGINIDGRSLTLKDELLVLSAWNEKQEKYPQNLQKKISIINSTFINQPAVEYTTKVDIAEKQINQRHLFIEKQINNDVKSLEFTITQNDKSDDLKIIDMILSTFRFLSEGETPPIQSTTVTTEPSFAAKVRNVVRKSDIGFLNSSIQNYWNENRRIPTNTNINPQVIAKTGIDICLDLKKYISVLPRDPLVDSGGHVSDCNSNYNTGYYINKTSSGNEIIVSAPFAEGEIIATSSGILK